MFSQSTTVERIDLLRVMVKWIRYDGEEVNIIRKPPFNNFLNRDEKNIQHPTAIKRNEISRLPQWVYNSNLQDLQLIELLNYFRRYKVS